MRGGFKKFTVALMLFLAAFTSLVGSLAPALPANAGMPVSVLESVPDKTKTILGQIWDAIKTAVLNAVVRLVSYAMRKVAYDGAVWLASGGKGQSPLAQTKGFGDYLQNVGNEAFGRAIESLSSDTGINLCKIPDIKTDLALKVGLRMNGPFGSLTPLEESQKPSCSFSEFQKNWLDGDAWKSKFNDTQNNITEQFSQALKDPGQNDFGIGLGGMEFVEQQVATKMFNEQMQRIEGRGINALTKKISGDIGTPAVVTEEEFRQNRPGKQQEKDEAQIASLLSSGDIKVIPTILSIFLNTLVSSMVKNYQEQGILPFGICVGDSGGEHCRKQQGEVAGSFESQGALGGRAAAQKLFSGILEPLAIGTVDDYNLLGQLNSCPDSPGLYNCRADEKLIDALRRAESGEPLTVQKALAEGLLHGDWKLLPPSRVAENNKDCYKTNNYCYANIKVLRQLRILPLGFEIAALRSDPDNPWTLQEVIDGFDGKNKKTGAENCKYRRDQNNNIIGVEYDPTGHPFCHLIDPNWVIKAPESRCNALVYGAAQLAPGISKRIQECADLSTCVVTDAKGKCLTYGYCSREKNVWRFNADECKSYNRTCRTFTEKESGASVSYLYRTLDTGICNQDNIGCNFYSLAQDNKGQWLGPGISQATGRSNGFYATGKLSTCSDSAAGCTAFEVRDEPGKLVNIRQAPDYLGCYDTNKNTAPIDWPETLADLVKLQPGVACQKYAAACIPAEVGCSLYKPVSAVGPDVPGKISINNVCREECVGYDAYREMPTGYSNGQDTVYITPRSPYAEVCVAEDKGCTAFTNLNSTSGGLEQVEYFTYLRPCVTSAQNPGKNFITYERSDKGFQLTTYTLVPDKDGGPAYTYKTVDDLKTYTDSCNEQKYKAGATLDCRQFNDDKGKIYYRLLSKTIPVSNACTDYRLNQTELYTMPSVADADTCADTHKGYWDQGKPAGEECQVCFQNGEFKDGQCYYRGLPSGAASTAGSSLSCSQTADTCREYKGSKGNNVKLVIPNDTFEDKDANIALTSWEPKQSIRQSLESTQLNGHSLGYFGNGKVTRMVTTSVGESYALTFWGKGGTNEKPATLVISLENGQGFAQKLGEVSLSDAWREFTIGPRELVDAKKELKSQKLLLTFQNQAGGNMFLDNVRLVEANAPVYLLKKSLRVDEACDAVPDDNLPGAALGCQAYQDTLAKRTVNLTGFDYLCREQSLGCTAVLNTNNTLTGGKVSAEDKLPRMYNVWLLGNSGTKVTISEGATELGSCQVAIGQSGCYAFTKEPLNGYVPEDLTKKLQLSSGLAPTLTPSSVFIPADTPTSSAMYIVVNQASVCSESDRGCVVAGKETIAPQGARYVTTTIKNDPVSYATTLCSSDAVGCKEYASDGGTTYFKDPATTGQKICTYKTNVKVKDNQGGTVEANGWFWKGVGMCRAGQPPFYCSADADCAEAKTCSKDPTQDCTRDEDCGGNKGTCVAKCQGIGAQACYPGYIDNDGYGLWSYGDKNKYQQFVGECPAEENLCTEFIDHNDKDAYDKPMAYYRIKNSRVTSGDCNGRVGPKFGCVLFEQTDNPTKSYKTSELYERSAANDGGLVDAVPTKDPKNDANIVLKVTQDRECAEWLQCRSSHRVWDQANNRWKNVCDDVGRCAAIGDATQKGTIANCARWVDGEHDFAGQLLTESLYAGRDVSWKGREYAGFSLLGMYPLEELQQVNVSAVKDQPDWRLAKLIPCAGNQDCANGARPGIDTACKNNNQTCGAGGIGICRNNLCVRNELSAPSQTCRGYPEEDSPFPNYKPLVTPGTGSYTQSFAVVNTCNEVRQPTDNLKKAFSCDCSYTKVQYGSDTPRYWQHDTPNSLDPLPGKGSIPGWVPPGICQGGDKAGQSCTYDADCSPALRPGQTTASVGYGSCQRRTAETKYQGWRGFCLEEDVSRSIYGDPKLHPCLTWLPIDNLRGAPDINNQNVLAGFSNKEEGSRYYCLETRGQVVVNGQDPQNKFNGVEPAKAYYFDLDQSFEMAAEELALGGIDITQKNYQVNRLDVEKIILQVIEGDAEDPQAGTALEIWPNDPAPQQAFYKVKLSSGKLLGNKDGLAVTGRWNGYQSAFGMFYSSPKNAGNDSGIIDKNGNVCLPGTKGDCGALQGNMFEKLTWDNNKYNLPVQPWNPIFGWDQAKQPDYNKYVESLKSSMCLSSNQEVVGNWNAVVFWFDENTNLLTWISGVYCDSSPEQGRIKYKITFKLREWCKTVAETVSDNKSVGERTVAWTDRTWKAGRFKFNGPWTYSFDTDISPFGSLGVVALPADKPVAMTPPEMPRCAGVDSGECKYFVEEPAFVPGAPYSAKNYVITTRSFVDANNKAKLEKVSTLGGVKGPALEYGFSRIFAKARKIFEFDEKNKKYSPVKNFLDELGKTEKEDKDFNDGNFRRAPVSPVISAVGACDPKDPDACAETTPGVVSAETKLTGAGTAQTYVKFFAYADAEQMPLRQVRVQWGDGTETKLNGLIRNHRGAVSESVNERCTEKPLELKCDNSETICKNDADCIVAAEGPQFYSCASSPGKCADNKTSCANDNDCIKQVCVRLRDGSLDCTNEDFSPCKLPAKTCQGGPKKGQACNADGDCTYTPPPPPPGKCNVVVKKDLRCEKTNRPCNQSGEFCVVDQICQNEDTAGNFGLIRNRTCDTSYFQFFHSYRCIPGGGSYWQTPNSPDWQLCVQNGYNEGCCVFQPLAQAMDNWNWYNGKCPGEPGGIGCFNREGQQDEGELPFGNGEGPWAPAIGKVVLPPKPVK